MRINLLCIGKTDRTELRELISYYQNRLPSFWNFELSELPDIKKNLSPELLKKEEAKLFLANIDRGDYIILLDENGKTPSSREFAAKLENLQNNSTKRVCFLIGGAYGFSEEIFSIANERLSLSKMTFTHQMVRLFFLEQLYRADQILQGKPYHND